MPHLHLIANGSGKSSFVREVRSGTRTIDYDIPGVINPDEIATEMNPGNPGSVAMSAGREALIRRNKALLAAKSFSIETTLSGHSELQLVHAARAAGYRVTVTYIALRDVERNVWRVTERATIEGRTVPAEDVRRRYERSLRNLTVVAEEFDALRVFDNSGKTFEHVLTMQSGRSTMLADKIPSWVEKSLARQLLEKRHERDLER